MKIDTYSTYLVKFEKRRIQVPTRINLLPLGINDHYMSTIKCLNLLIEIASYEECN